MFQLHADNRSKVQAICNFAGSRVNPIYAQVLVSAQANAVSFVSCSGNQQCEAIIQTIVDADGVGNSFLVDAKRLSAALQAINADVLKFKLKDGSLIVSGGKSRLKLSIGEADVFPLMQAKQANLVLPEIPLSEFMELAHMTRYSVPSSDVRMYLNYHQLTVKNGTISVTGTDGHRLSHFDSTIEANGEGSYLLHPSVFDALHSQKLHPDTKVSIEFNETHVSVRSDEFHLLSVMGDGRYPDISRVIPKSPFNRFSTPLALLRDLNKRLLSLCSLEKGLSSIKLVFDPIDGASDTVTVRIESDNTNFEEALPITDVQGCDGMILGINPAYLADALSTQTGENVTFHFGGDSNTTSSAHIGAIKIESDTDGLITLLMPMAV